MTIPTAANRPKTAEVTPQPLVQHLPPLGTDSELDG